jgi:hypothetical protein
MKFYRLHSKSKVYSAKKIITKSSLLVLFLLTVTFLGSCIYFANHPIYLVKSATIKPTENFKELITLHNKNKLEISPILSNIPYRNDYISTILPRKRYYKTIIDGHGDCSNLTYGLAYYLNKHEYQYIIIHFLTIDEFLDNGHVTLQTTYTHNNITFTGIIDILEGGLPTDDKGHINIQQLLDGNHNSISIYPLSPLKDNLSKYYSYEYLDNSVIGVMVSKDVINYFNFIDSIYIPLMNEKFEQYFYLTFSLLANKIPAIYLSKDDYEILFHNHLLTKYAALYTLWMLRVVLILIAVAFVAFFIFYLKKRLFSVFT